MRSPSSARTASGRCSRRNDRGSARTAAALVALRGASPARRGRARRRDAGSVPAGRAAPSTRRRSIRSGSRRRCPRRRRLSPRRRRRRRRPRRRQPPTSTPAARPRAAAEGLSEGRGLPGRATSARRTSARRSSCRRTSSPSTTARGRSRRSSLLYWSRKGDARATRWCSRSTGTSTRRRTLRRAVLLALDDSAPERPDGRPPVSWSREPGARSFGIWPLFYASNKFGWAVPFLRHVQRRRLRRSAISTARCLGLYWWKRVAERRVRPRRSRRSSSRRATPRTPSPGPRR